MDYFNLGTHTHKHTDYTKVTQLKIGSEQTPDGQRQQHRMKNMDGL